MTEEPKALGQRFVFWRVANGFVVRPGQDHREVVDDAEVFVFGSLEALFVHLRSVYEEKHPCAGVRQT